LNDNPTSEKNKNSITITLNEDLDGKEFTVENIEDIPDDPDKVCTTFTITVEDIDGNEDSNKPVKLVNERTDEIIKDTTNDDGQIKKDSADLPAGKYKVYENKGTGNLDDDIYIGEITVNYDKEKYEDYSATVKPADTSVSVTKNWVDVNTDERPESITVNLLADGAKVDEKEITESEKEDDSTWTYTFENLPKYKNAAQDEIEYKVEEVEADELTGYEITVDDDAEDGFIITNTQQTTEVEVTKVWEEVDSQYRPDSIKLVVKDSNGKEFAEKTLIGGERDEWKHTFTNLPTHDKDGNEITYTVEEVALTGYETDTTENDEEGFTITNTQEVIEIEGTKTWKDDNASDRPEDITIQVLIDGTETVVAKEEIGTEENETYKFENLPKYDKDGEEIKYVINESYVPGYTATAEPNEYDITNTRTEKADISITKKWLDEDETDRPESITVQLYQNNEKYEDEVTITPDDKGQWIYTFADLELFDADGNAYTYDVKEINVDEKYEAQEEVQWDAEENSFV